MHDYYEVGDLVILVGREWKKSRLDTSVPHAVTRAGCSGTAQIGNGWYISSEDDDNPGWHVQRATPMKEGDAIDHPSHYTSYKGIEVIQLTEQMNFNRGNAVKYIARAGLKDPEKEIEDLEKSAWYINREIERLKGAE